MSDSYPGDSSNSPDEPSWGEPTQPPPYQAPQYNQQYNAGGAYGPGGEHPQGTMILILGILSLVCCGLFTGIPAIIMGRKALREIDAAPGRFSNRGIVNGGYICGIIGTVLSALGVIFYVIVAIAALSTGTA